MWIVIVDESEGTNDDVVFVTRVRMGVVMKKIKMMVMMIGGGSSGGDDDDDDDDDNGDVSVMSVGKHDYLFFSLPGEQSSRR